MVRRLPNDEPGRLARIHDARYLQMGVDLKALQEQLQVHQRAAAQEAEDRRKAAANQAAQAAVSQASHTRQLVEEREALIKLQRFRQQSQGLQRGRDWDLSRPDSLRIDLPARFGDKDPRCGIASLQKFSGEDLDALERQEQQGKQDRQFWEAQANCKAKEAALQAAARKDEELKVRELDACQASLKLLEAKYVRDTNIATAALNKAADEKRKALEAQRLIDEEEVNRKEIESKLSSQFLTEADTTSAQPYSVSVSDFKGLSKATREAVILERQCQVEKQALLQKERSAEEAAFSQSQAGATAQLHKDLLKEHLTKKAQGMAAGCFLERQIEDKAIRDKALRSLYANAVSPEYFAQFETSHR